MQPRHRHGVVWKENDMSLIGTFWFLYVVNFGVLAWLVGTEDR